MFAIVDIETTGSYAAANGITEIAVVVSDGLRIQDRFSTLVNPQQGIPLAIQKLTGIDDNMVREAPSFTEIAPQLKEILGKHIFVAHNVHFDLSFIQAAFKAEGIDYKPRRLCTVRYGRRIEKGLRSYSLSNLSKHFDLQNKAAHRAWGDAEVTTELLHKLLAKDRSGQWQQMIKANSGELKLPVKLPEEEFHRLPQAAGVYYFYDAQGNILYVGKATRLKSRVASHFTADKTSARSSAFKREIAHIHYQLCGNILMAGLWEDHEIRRLWPPHNRAQKSPKTRFGIFKYHTQSDQVALGINRLNKQQSFLISFHNLEKARAWLAEKVEHYQLDPALCGFPKSSEADQIDHRLGVERLEADLNRAHGQRILLSTGRDVQEQAFIHLDEEGFQSMGFLPKSVSVHSVEDLEAYQWEVNTSASTEGIISEGLTKVKYREVLLSQEA